MQDKWVRAKEAMELLGCTRPQLRYRADIGKIERRKIKGKNEFLKLFWQMV